MHISMGGPPQVHSILPMFHPYLPCGGECQRGLAPTGHFPDVQSHKCLHNLGSVHTVHILMAKLA